MTGEEPATTGPLTADGLCAFHPDLPPGLCTELGRRGCVGCLLSARNLDPRYAAPEPVDVVDCDWEHGVCLCPTCGAVIRVVPRVRFTPRVLDADGRAHYCERYIAATMARHGLAGMQALVDQHGARPVIEPPGPVDPSSEAPPPIWQGYEQ